MSGSADRAAGATVDDDAAHIAALIAGEAAAVDRLYREHAGRVLAWVLRLGGPHLDAEDVAHEVFLKALDLLPGFRGEAKLSTWLFGVTRRVVANARRKAVLRRWFGLAEAPEPRDPGLLSDEAVALLRRRRAVQHALERLPTRQREVLVLADLEELPAPEVAELLGVPVGTVYSRLHHARRRFAGALQREGLERAHDDQAAVIPLRRSR